MQSSIKRLVAVFTVLLVMSVYVLKNNIRSSVVEQQFLIPELLTYINDVDKILLQKNNQKIHLLKKADTWRVVQANGFFADTNKVASLLLDLRKFELKEIKTNIPEKYPKIGLSESGEQAAINIILNNSETQIANIWIGNTAQRSQGTYVRKNSETQTWLSDGNLKINFDSKDWIVSTILDVNVQNIKSVKFASIDSEAFTINKLTPQDESFQLVEKLNNTIIENNINLNKLALGLQKFTVESVVKSIKDKKNLLVTIVYELFSGIQYHLKIHEINGIYITSINVVNLPQGFKYEEQLSQWDYVIPEYKFEALNFKLSDISNKITEIKEK